MKRWKMEKTIKVISLILTLAIIVVALGGIGFYGMKPITDVPWVVIVCTAGLIFYRGNKDE